MEKSEYSPLRQISRLNVMGYTYPTLRALTCTLRAVRFLLAGAKEHLRDCTGQRTSIVYYNKTVNCGSFISLYGLQKVLFLPVIDPCRHLTFSKRLDAMHGPTQVLGHCRIEGDVSLRREIAKEA